MTDFIEQQIKYKIAVIQEKLTIWIQNVVTSMTWKGSVKEAARTLEIEILRQGKKTEFQLGDSIIIYNSKTNEELMRFIIIKKNITGSGQTIKYTARDIRWWLTRNKIDKKFENMTASQIFIEVCKMLEIKTGEIADTKIVFPVLHFINKSSWDIIITALTETRKQGGGKFITKIKKGRLELLERVKQVSKWVIEGGVNLLESTYEENIENTYTQIYISGNTETGDTITALKTNESAKKKYGVMQEYLNESEKTTQEKLNKIAQEKLKELSVLQKSGSIKAFGVDEIESGSAIYVVDKETGLKGGFFVESDTHSYVNGYHEMNLTLSWTNELPTIEYEAPKSNSSGGSRGGFTVETAEDRKESVIEL